MAPGAGEAPAKRAREVDSVLVPKHMRSRLLYTNPVCFLTSRDPDSGQHNVMTITWLTAIDNRGNFVCSVNEKRHTASVLRKNPSFVLSVPAHGMESTILSVGSYSGADLDKFRALQGQITLCGVGWTEREATATGAIEESVAQMACTLVDMRELHGHLLCNCRIDAGHVRHDYWSGKTFKPQPGTSGEPYLTFFGSKQFGSVTPQDE